jgi:hypothetical protein
MAMPKRIIDGQGVWRSDKLARVGPAKFRAEYANILRLSLANGVFESSPSRVWAEVYSFNRPDIARSDVERLLQAFEDVGLLFRWTDEGGKAWAYFTGSEKRGRLPAKSLRERYGVGPEPPADKLAEYLQRNGQAPPSVPGEAETAPAPEKRSMTLPDNFGISDEVREWAKSKGYTRLEEHLEHFIGVAKAKGYTYRDWQAAFRNAIRDNWAKVDRGPVAQAGKSVMERTKAALESK